MPPPREGWSGFIKPRRHYVISASLILVLSYLTLFVLSLTYSYDGSRVKRSVLDNGMVLIAEEDHSDAVVAFEVRVKAGLISEAAFAGSGISHFVEHMLFKGTPARPAGRIEQEIRGYGGAINAFTSLDYTGFSVVVEKEYFMEALELINDVLRNSSFDEQEIEKEREVVLNEIRLNNDDPERYIHRLLWSSAFLSHPYKDPVIGYEGLFKKLTRGDLLAYFHSNYAPNNMVLAICGDIDASIVIEQASKVFGDFQRQFPPMSVHQHEPLQMQERKVEEERKVNLTYCMLGFKGVSVTHDDMYPLDVLAMILGEGKSSRLYEAVQLRQLAHSIASYNYTPRDSGLFIISATLNAENKDLAIEAIFKEIERIKTRQVSEAELEEAKNEALADYYFNLKSVQSKAASRATNELLTGDHDFSKTYVAGIQSVARKDILRAANKYLIKKNLTTVIVSPEKEPLTIQPIKDTEMAVLSLASSAHSGIKKEILSNGLTVLFKEDHRLPVVSICVAMNGGLTQEEESKQGVSNLTANMLTAGTHLRSASKIADEIEAVGGRIITFSGRDSFGITLDLLSKDFKQGLSILEDILSDAAFDEREFERLKQETMAGIRMQKDDIFDSGSRLLRLKLFPAHPYRHHPLGTEDSVINITRQDCMNFYKRFVRSDNMVISIFGDISKEQIESSLAATLGNLSKPKIPLTIEHSFKEGRPQPSQTTDYMVKEQALVMLGFIGVPLSSEDRYPLEVMGEILSGGGGRLYSQIRERLGLSYALGASSVFGARAGYIVFYVATDASSVSTVQENLLAQIDLLRAGNLDDAEINLAKESLIGRQKIETLQDISVLAKISALDELYGLGFDNYLKYEDMVRDVTSEDVRQVADRYLTKDLAVSVLILPKCRDD